MSEHAVSFFGTALPMLLMVLPGVNGTYSPPFLGPFPF
jgi:hypothetical protein